MSCQNCTASTLKQPGSSSGDFVVGLLQPFAGCHVWSDRLHDFTTLRLANHIISQGRPVLFRVRDGDLDVIMMEPQKSQVTGARLSAVWTS